MKPKNKSIHQISIGETHALIRNSHTIRRRLLSQKQDSDFTMKVLEYQEIFHKEVVRKIFFYIIFHPELPSFSYFLSVTPN